MSPSHQSRVWPLPAQAVSRREEQREGQDRNFGAMATLKVAFRGLCGQAVRGQGCRLQNTVGTSETRPPTIMHSTMTAAMAAPASMIRTPVLLKVIVNRTLLGFAGWPG